MGKDKKRKEAPVDADAAAAEAKKEKKRAKKEKKEKAAAAAAAAAAAEAQAAADKKAAKKAKKEAKKSKKDKKKKDKSSSSAAASASPAASSQKSSPSSSSQSSTTTHTYVEHPDVAAMTQADIDAHRKKAQLTLTSDVEFKPVVSFAHLTSVDPQLMRITKPFTAPSAIQSQCWPIALSGRDCIGIAETGSGKTLGFALPAFARIFNIIRREPLNAKKVHTRGPLALCITPTRELAMQINEVCEEMCSNTSGATKCTAAVVFGGVPQWQQVAALKNGVHFVTATPGRLQGMLRDGVISLARCEYLILDEADRMLDMGFIPSIREIVAAITSPVPRQTMLFSATWPDEVKKLAAQFVTNPVRVNVGAAGLDGASAKANKRVSQVVEVLDPYAREKRLQQLLAQTHKSRSNRVLVFVLYKKEAARIEQAIRRWGYNVCAIHGDKTQEARTAALRDFKSAKCPLLVATDVAARGLDIPDVEYVINFSFPLTVEDYIHRIGRTGRAGKTGSSFTFFTSNDKSLSGQLINVLNESGAKVPEALMKFGTGVKKKVHPLYGAFYKDNGGKPMKKAVRMVL